MPTSISTNEVARILRTNMGPEAADALAYLLMQGASKCIPIPLGSITQEDGTALLKQATTVAGYAQISNKETVINIPVNCTAGESLGFTVSMPEDLKAGGIVTVKVLASKVEGGTADELTLDCEAYFCAAGDLGNADAISSSAQTIVTAGTVLHYNVTPASVLAPPCTMSVVLALGGTNDADAVYIHGVWVEYETV